MAKRFMWLRELLEVRRRWVRLRWRVGRAFEVLRYATVRPDTSLRFHVVSASRNAGEAAVRCLQSVYDQDFPRDRVHHVYIDDASTDDTEARVREWLQRHPDHNVEYVRRDVRLGGAANNLAGFELSGPRDIVAELNGDDWFPDAGVLTFLAKVYASPDVWKTYNTPRVARGLMTGPRRIPPAVVRDNAYRDARWWSSALHTFRRELYDHVDKQVMIDPDTGEYWESADDQALYLAMLELAGAHSRHLFRVTYFYNFRELSEHNVDRDGQRDRNQRIRQQPRHRPLERL